MRAGHRRHGRLLRAGGPALRSDTRGAGSVFAPAAILVGLALGVGAGALLLGDAAPEKLSELGASVREIGGPGPEPRSAARLGGLAPLPPPVPPPESPPATAPFAIDRDEEEPLLRRWIGEVAGGAKLALDHTVGVAAGRSTGSGTLIDIDGEPAIVTAEHVVKDARYVRVVTTDGRVLYGQVTGRDVARDVARVALAPGLAKPAVEVDDYVLPEDGDRVFTTGFASRDLTVTFNQVTSEVGGEGPSAWSRAGWEIMMTDEGERPLQGQSGAPIWKLDQEAGAIAPAGMLQNALVRDEVRHGLAGIEGETLASLLRKLAPPIPALKPKRRPWYLRWLF